MSESDQFRQYAEEALLWVAQSKTEEEERLLLELVRTWRKAAIVSAAVVSGTKERAHAAT
jgi:3-deoxy-D-manno-octulosonic-acid transferase